MGLLRSKAISLLYCNPRCPLLTALACRYMELTSGFNHVDPRGFWENKLFSEALELSHVTECEHKKGITYQDRLDFEMIYNISPRLQTEIENYFNSSGLGPLDNPALDSIYGPDYWAYRDYFDRFTGTLSELA